MCSDWCHRNEPDTEAAALRQFRLPRPGRIQQTAEIYVLPQAQNKATWETCTEGHMGRVSISLDDRSSMSQAGKRRWEA